MNPQIRLCGQSWIDTANNEEGLPFISHYGTHAEAGKFVTENSVDYMVEEVMQDIKNGNFQKCSNEIMNPNLASLKKGLEQYGVTDLKIVDSNHNHVVDKATRSK